MACNGGVTGGAFCSFRTFELMRRGTSEYEVLGDRTVVSDADPASCDRRLPGLRVLASCEVGERSVGVRELGSTFGGMFISGDIESGVLG